MNKSTLLALVTTVALTATAAVQAQVKTAAPSPLSKLDQVVGVTNFSVEYSRPGAKDREIYGDLVPFGELWRTGANAPTKLSFDTEVTFGGETIPAGDYVLFTIPGEDEWTVIVYGDAAVQNTGAYDEKNDVARVTVKPTALTEPVETFTIGFDDLRDDSATLFLDWTDVRVPVDIEIDTNALSKESIEEASKNMDAWKPADYANAASFYFDNDMDLDQAVKWMEKAAASNDQAFWWQHGYAKMLAKQGKKDEAIAAAKKSLETAKAAPGGGSGYVERNEQLLSTLQ